MNWIYCVSELLNIIGKRRLKCIKNCKMSIISSSYEKVFGFKFLNMPETSTWLSYKIGYQMF